MDRARSFALPLCFALSLISGSASAHFRLLKPASWLNEDKNGGPQKGSPCGIGGFDEPSPIPISGAVTTYKAGETITVEWVDTIPHPGYYRIALAKDRADLKDPTIAQDIACSFDESQVPTKATGNVLADGVDFRSRNNFDGKAGEMHSHQVTLPNEPCEKCTLQVMQVMENDLQTLSNCYYFHCADIRIVAANDDDDAGAPSGTVTYEDSGVPESRSDDEPNGPSDGEDDDETSGEGGPSPRPQSSPSEKSSSCSVTQFEPMTRQGSFFGLAFTLTVLCGRRLRRRATSRRTPATP